MDDAVAVALITGGSTGLTGVWGALLSYKAGRRHADVSVSSAQAQARVDVARINAENERLREQYREDERRNRQGTYHRFLAHFDRLDFMGGGWADVNATLYEEWLAEFYFLVSAIDLFAPTHVRDALGPLISALEQFGSHHGEAPDPNDDEGWETWFRRTYVQHRESIISAQAGLLEGMRRDVSRHLESS